MVKPRFMKMSEKYFIASIAIFIHGSFAHIQKKIRVNLYFKYMIPKRNKRTTLYICSY